MTCPVCEELVERAYAEWRKGKTLAQAEMLRDAAANLAHHLTHLIAKPG